MSQQLDSVFSRLGTGYWNYLHYVIIGYGVGMIAPQALTGAFLTPRVPFRCLKPPDEEETSHFDNKTKADSCKFLSSGDDQCLEWEFDNSTFTNTVTSEFELICQKDYLRATFQSLYMIGVLVGSPINGIMADRYGRKSTFIAGSVIFTIIANISCWLPNLPALMASRFFLGTMHTTVLKTGYILAMEITDPKMRSSVGIGLFLPWALGTIAWGGVAYFIRSWRYLLMSVSLPCLLLLPALWPMDESPRWLVVKGRHKQALEVLKKASRWNKVTLPPDHELLPMMESNCSENKDEEQQATASGWRTILKKFTKGVVILFRTPRLRIISFVTHIEYLALGMVYFGLSLSGGNFNFDQFFYMALTGLVEIPAYTIMAPIVSHFGRRMPVALCYLITGLILLIQPFLTSDYQWIIITCAMIGKMAISMSFQGNNLFASELFPTEVRTRGVSSSFMMSRVGSSISPFITEYLVLFFPWAPSVVFGVAAAVAGIATLMAWETHGLALPDTIAYLESPNFKPVKRYSRKTAPAPEDNPESTTTTSTPTAAT